MIKLLRPILFLLSFSAVFPSLPAQVWQHLLESSSGGSMAGLATNAAGDLVLARRHPWYTPAWRFSADGTLLDTLLPPVVPNGLEGVTAIDTAADGGFLLAVNYYQTTGAATEGQIWEWRPGDTVVYRGGTSFREITALAHLPNSYVLATWDADAGTLELIKRTPGAPTILAQTTVATPVMILINGTIPYWVTGSQRVTALTVDGAGNVYVTGWRIGQPLPQGGQSTAETGFVAKYSAGLDSLGLWWSGEAAGYFDASPVDLQVAADGTVWMLTRQGRLRRLSAVLDAVLADVELPSDSCYALLPVPDDGNGFFVSAVHNNCVALYRYDSAGNFVSEKITQQLFGTIVNLRSVVQPDGIVHAAEFYHPQPPDTLPDYWVFKLAFDESGTTEAENPVPEGLKLFFWPNPAAQAGHIELGLPGTVQASLSLFNTAGRRVWHSAASSGRTTVPLHDLPRGVYWLMVTVEGKTYLYPWQVQG